MKFDVAEKIAGHDLVSFDVFDTLIFRAIEAPTDVFKLVRSKLLTSSSALFDPATINAFPAMRVRAEHLARIDNVTSSGCEEINFAKIYAKLAEISHAMPETLTLLAKTELETEQELVYANPVAFELFEYARSLGKSIILCSDMYLPKEVVADLLDLCGYVDYKELYLSCEHGLSKYRGTLFPHVAHLHDVPAGRIIHIGDNPHGDILMAERAGCTAVHLPPLGSFRAFETPFEHNDSNADIVSAVVNGIIRKRENLSDASVDPWEDLGFRIFGPLFTGFLLWLRSAVASNLPDLILLFARDTHWLQAVLDRFLAGLSKVPDINYIYVSRASLLLPSMTDFPLKRLNHLFSGRIARSVEQHLRRLGLNPEVLAPVIRSAGFRSQDEAVLNGDPRMRVLMGKLHRLVLRESAQRRPIVQDYLDQFVAHANDVMLVDIGWVGNMQTSFSRLLISRHPAMRLRGYYVGVFGSSVDNTIPGHPMHGWLARANDSRDIERAMWWVGGVELLEFAMRAPHGTTLSYERRSDGTVSPLIETSLYEDKTADLAARLQRGASSFIEQFLSLYGKVPTEGLVSRGWGSSFYRLVTDPTSAETELLGDLTHSDAAGETGQRLALAPKVTGSAERIEAYRQSFWTAGFIVRNELNTNETYDEELYLYLNPDVRAAVEASDYPSGFDHWINFGQAEGRKSSWSELLRGELEHSLA